MSETTPALLALAGLAFLLAGCVKGVTGLGLPTVAIGLLGLFMAPAQAAAMLVVPSLVTNLWQLLAGPAFGMLLRRLRGMLVGVCLGTWAGQGWLDGGSLTTALLGAALLAYALLGLSAVRFSVPARAEAWLAPLVGLATGMVTAATGVFVLPAVPYLQALGLQKEELVQALGLSFTVSTIALGLMLAGGGLLQPDVAGLSVLAVVPALAGMFAGQWLRRKISAETFRKCFFLGLLLLGAHLLLRAVA